jgi:hypothetical protein
MTTQQSWTPATGISNYVQPEVMPAKATTTQTPQAPLSGGLLGTAATATAQTREVNPNELVSNQIADITKQDSPLMQQASSRAFQNANSRGLLNSSMANESAVGAVLDRATPIASSNAATLSNVANQNLANNQQTQTFNAQQTQNNNQFNVQQEQQNNQFNVAEANKNNIFNASEQNAVLKQFLEQGNRLQLADIEASYKTVLQSEASAGTLYQQSIRNISDILQNPDLTAEAKTAAVNNQNEMLRTGLNILGKIGGLNLDGLLQFPSA